MPAQRNVEGDAVARRSRRLFWILPAVGMVLAAAVAAFIALSGRFSITTVDYPDDVVEVTLIPPSR